MMKCVKPGLIEVIFRQQLGWFAIEPPLNHHLHSFLLPVVWLLEVFHETGENHDTFNNLNWAVGADRSDASNQILVEGVV